MQEANASTSRVENAFVSTVRAHDYRLCFTLVLHGKREQVRCSPVVVDERTEDEHQVVGVALPQAVSGDAFQVVCAHQVRIVATASQTRCGPGQLRLHERPQTQNTCEIEIERQSLRKLQVQNEVFVCNWIGHLTLCQRVCTHHVRTACSKTALYLTKPKNVCVNILCIDK